MLPINNIAVRSIICLKEGDAYVSYTIEELGGWEIPIVTKLLEAMENYPDAIFIGKTTIMTLAMMTLRLIV